MTNKPAKYTGADIKDIPPERYFRSLIRKAEESGWEVSVLRLGILQLTQRLAKRMAFGASSSMRIEPAQGLLESVFYCIGHGLKRMGEKEAIEAVGGGDAPRLWEQGKKALEEDFQNAEKLLALIRNNMLITRNIAYNSTIGEGLELFFKSYDTQYAAHETPGSIDYQLSLPIPPLTGIEYISEYLRRVAIENEFCLKYADETGALLLGLNPSPEDLMVSIYETALLNAAGKVLCGLGGESLDITPGDRERLYTTLGGMTKESLGMSLSAAADRACAQAGIDDQASRSYARGTARAASAHVFNALENRSLEAVFVSLKKAWQKPKFTDAVSMDDETFRAVTEEIRSCRFVSDKAALLKRSVKSIRDLSDMLGADCFYKGEYDQIFGAFDEETLALLYKTIPQDGYENEWQTGLIRYLKGKGIEERVRKAAEEIETE